MTEEKISEDGPVLTIGGSKLYLDSVNEEGKQQIAALQEADKALSTLKALRQSIAGIGTILDLASIGFEAMAMQAKDKMLTDGAIAVAEPAVTDGQEQAAH